MKAHIRRKTPERKAAKHGAAKKAAEQSQPPDPLLDQYRLEISQAQQAAKVAYPLRLDTPQAWREWVAAVHHQYDASKKYASLYFAHEPFLEEDPRYNWDFWRDIELLRGGDRTKLEAAIAFLEADPCFFGSGYAKEDIIPAINRLDLPPNLAERLQTVVLNMVDRRDGREFRAYCRLARKVDSPELREQLLWRLTRARPSSAALTGDQPSLLKEIEPDKNIRRRARWVLEALGQKDT